MSNLLYNDQPIPVSPTMAAWVGLNEAIFLQQLHFWLQNPKMGQVEDGTKWIRNTTREWLENFPFWDSGVIKRTIQNLEQDGLINSKTFTGRSKWYTINYETLNNLSEPVERLAAKKELRKEARALVQNVPMDEPDETEENEPVLEQSVPILSVQNVPIIGTKCSTSKTTIDYTPNGVGKKLPSAKKNRGRP